MKNPLENYKTEKLIKLAKELEQFVISEDSEVRLISHEIFKGSWRPCELKSFLLREMTKRLEKEISNQ